MSMDPGSQFLLRIIYETSGRENTARWLRQTVGPAEARRMVATLDAMDNPVQVRPRDWELRMQRLEGGEQPILYHQTSHDAARAILATGEMLRGAVGVAGGGIYFAMSPEDTARKAHQHGVILACRVKVGYVRKIDGPDNTICFTWLLRRRYDSVRIDLRSGPEIVVYNKDQVEPLHIVNQ